MDKDGAEPRTPILDEVGVSHTKDGIKLYTSLSTLDVGDLLSEGEIEGLVKGEHHFAGNAGEIGYQTYTFKPYTALDKDGSCSEKLGYLRSIYWNETPVVDKNGFYNFQEVNVEWTEGTPQGKLPALNPNLPNDKNLKGQDGFELTLFRSIGERLFGPTIELGEGKTPGYYHGGDGAPDFLGNGSRNSPIILGDIDRNAKIYTVSNKECVAVRVNIKVTKLLESIQDDQKDDVKVLDGSEEKIGFFAQPEGTAKDGLQQEYGGGDMRARKVKYQIYVRPIFDTKNFKGKQGASRTDNSDEDLFIPWPESPSVEEEIFGRIEEPYIRSVEIALSNSERDGARKDYFLGWEIKIVRLTPDSFHTFLKNDSYVDSIVEVYDSKLRYPYCAMVYSRYSAEFFSRIPSRHYDTKLLKVKIPNNYDPLLRKYDESSGFWDGCFEAKKEWTNNPAWCFYDLLTNNRYGLGDYIDSKFVDKWTLYDIAKYCDVLVSDGKGGLEPRFTLNHIITSREEAYKVVNELASAFRAIAYYAFGNIYVSQDSPKDPIYHFNTSNAIDGIFTYTSSAKKARHTVAIVRYSDKNNLYKPAISYTEDQAGIQRYGIREVETSAIGCTSEAQAKRFGEWILKSEILETESISFSAGQEGMYIRPGDVISVYDEFRNDKKMAGRTLQVQKLGSGTIPAGAIPSDIDPPTSSIHPVSWTQHPGGAWLADKSHSNLAQTSTSGSGSGALFNVGVDLNGAPTFTWVSGGTRYVVGDTLTFTDPGYASDHGVIRTVDLTVNGLESPNDYYMIGNSIIIDKAIDFTADKEYKLDILTPAGYLEPTQITPPDCEETITTRVVEINEEEEKIIESKKSYLSPISSDALNAGSGTEPCNDTVGKKDDFCTKVNEGFKKDGLNSSPSFINELEIAVDSPKAIMEFHFQNFDDESFKDARAGGRDVQFGNDNTVSLPGGTPKRFEISYELDGKKYYLPLHENLQEFQEVSDAEYAKGELLPRKFTSKKQEKLGAYYIGSNLVPIPNPNNGEWCKDQVHGEYCTNKLTSSAGGASGAKAADTTKHYHGDLFKCLEWYTETDNNNNPANGTADEKTAAERELLFIQNALDHRDSESADLGSSGVKKYPRTRAEITEVGKDGDKGPIRHHPSNEGRFTAFIKPAGITNLKVTVFAPVNNKSTFWTDGVGGGTSYTTPFRIGLTRTHEWATTVTTEKRIVEDITVKSTNTDKSLTSADVPEIRRSQIQTIYFSGFQAVTHTGNFSSDYSIGGSGIVTQIFTDTQTQGQLDFDNYVITGYNAASVIGELSDDENEYSSDYENISGADLVWSIEPRINDMTLNRDYTLDPEFASGHAQQYKVININENESKYDITALEHTPVKYDKLGEDDPGEQAPITIPGGPPENPTMEQDSEENPNPGVKGACCVEDQSKNINNPDGTFKTYHKDCFSDVTENYCDSLTDDLWISEFFPNETCEQINCKTPEEIKVKPILPKEEDDEKFINLNFKIAADFTSISHFKGEDTNKYKLKMFTDQEAYDKNLMGVGVLVGNNRASKEAALGKYYDHLGCINLPPSCSDRNLESDDCYAEQYEKKVEQYGSNFVICKTAVFEGPTSNDSFKSLTDDECSKVKKVISRTIADTKEPIEQEGMIE